MARDVQAEQGDDAARTWPAPSASKRGWFGLTLGAATVKVEAQRGSAPPSADAEGEVSGGGSFALLYEKQLWGPLGARGFSRRTGWETALSQATGDGSRAVYDFGAAPVLAFAGRGGRRGISWFVYAPLSFSLSHAPARGERSMVLESMDLGTGYRVGLGVGTVFRFPSSKLGMVLEAEGALQSVSHVRSYRRADGAGGSTQLPIEYEMEWVVATIGLAFFP
jgi:hypothetical protein